MKGKQMARELERHGWCRVRQKGSHHTYKHPERPDHIVVPWADSGRDLDPGLVQAIIHQLRRGARRVKGGR